MKKRISFDSDSWEYENGTRCGFVYVLTLTSTGKIYIGSTADPYRRYYRHISTLISGKHENIRMNEDFERYGGDIDFEIIEVCPRWNVCSYELYWQIKKESYLYEVGYNNRDKRIVSSVTHQFTRHAANLIKNRDRLGELLNIGNEDDPKKRTVLINRQCLFSIESHHYSIKRRKCYHGLWFDENNLTEKGNIPIYTCAQRKLMSTERKVQDAKGN